MKIPTLYSTIVAGLLVCLVVGCTTRSAVDQVLTPTHRDFGGLFVGENITRLDNAVLLGSIWNLVVNPKGELLVLDTHSQGVHLFSPDGKLVWTMAITDCNPEANFSFGAQASFLDDSRVAVLMNKGAIILGQYGECVQTITDTDLATNTWGLCSFQDTIFAMPRYFQDSTFIRAYSSDFTMVDQFPLPAPKFQRRASVMLTNPGFAVGCFDDDVWWVYSESFDATPRLSRVGRTRFMPDFFVERTRDYPEFGSVGQLSFTEMVVKAEAEASRVMGIFTLDNETRMIVYNSIDPSNEGLHTGAIIANHSDRFPAVSTRFEETPEAIGNGRLYFVGDLEDESVEEVLNPTIISYRFVPPSGE
ncbi:MAG: hypothetical protein F4246_12080 [Rhodothermaceae bacterium]|nr:hypothetical protein [Rhodothermaceae bacterium]MXX59383.1 hypothetical protein [Rhodothermaceae bacterium]MYD18246.1 hypothetical protein [Rhodothermaceae bacterium]MYD57734.1 hypothetical protein [Rhodothermaceae bacterium]MYI44160.1 hypothetical protein [Rhodothermaceae bacterium]